MSRQAHLIEKRLLLVLFLVALKFVRAAVNIKSTPIIREIGSICQFSDTQPVCGLVEIRQHKTTFSMAETTSRRIAGKAVVNTALGNLRSWDGNVNEDGC